MAVSLSGKGRAGTRRSNLPSMNRVIQSNVASRLALAGTVVSWAGVFVYLIDGGGTRESLISMWLMVVAVTWLVALVGLVLRRKEPDLAIATFMASSALPVHILALALMVWFLFGSSSELD